MTQLVQRAGLIQPPMETPFPDTENDGTREDQSLPGPGREELEQSR